MAKSERLLSFIPDKTLFKAVSFARSLIRKGVRPDIANNKAARYYRVDVSDVAHHIGKLASRVKKKRKQLG